MITIPTINGDIPNRRATTLDASTNISALFTSV
jgi:hypothetical protein